MTLTLLCTRASICYGTFAAIMAWICSFEVVGWRPERARTDQDKSKDVYLIITPTKTLSFESESLPVSLRYSCLLPQAVAINVDVDMTCLRLQFRSSVSRLTLVRCSS